MIINNILIEKLHGLYNYDISFPLERNVTIITGPNGYGKTTILKIISHILECKFWFFYFLEFERICVTFGNGRILDIEKRSSEGISKEEDEIVEIVDTRESISVALYVPEKTEPIEMLSLGAQYSHRLVRDYARRIFFGGQVENFDLEKKLETEYILDNDTYLNDLGKNILIFLQEQKCLYIREQRILSVGKQSDENRRNPKSDEFEIDALSKELKDSFEQKQREFAVKSQEIDATFIERLINQAQQTYCQEEFERKRKKLNEKIEKYEKYGLAPNVNLPQGYPDELQKVLSLYIDDMEAKLSVYDEFYTKLSLFDHFVSSKCLSNKSIELGDNGIRAINDNKEIIPLRKLSSGEQNLLILYYKLVFSLKPHTLLLIDEPETSLHVGWVTNMLDDYREIAENLQCQIIIATHSITFINGQWDITFDLFEQNK